MNKRSVKEGTTTDAEAEIDASNYKDSPAQIAKQIISIRKSPKIKVEEKRRKQKQLVSK